MMNYNDRKALNQLKGCLGQAKKDLYQLGLLINALCGEGGGSPPSPQLKKSIIIYNPDGELIEDCSLLDFSWTFDLTCIGLGEVEVFENFEDLKSSVESTGNWSFNSETCNFISTNENDEDCTLITENASCSCNIVLYDIATGESIEPVEELFCGSGFLVEWGIAIQDCNGVITALDPTVPEFTVSQTVPGEGTIFYNPDLDLPEGCDMIEPLTVPLPENCPECSVNEDCGEGEECIEGTCVCFCELGFYERNLPDGTSVDNLIVDPICEDFANSYTTFGYLKCDGSVGYYGSQNLFVNGVALPDNDQEAKTYLLENFAGQTVTITSTYGTPGAGNIGCDMISELTLNIPCCTADVAIQSQECQGDETHVVMISYSGTEGNVIVENDLSGVTTIPVNEQSGNYVFYFGPSAFGTIQTITLTDDNNCPRILKVGIPICGCEGCQIVLADISTDEILALDCNTILNNTLSPQLVYCDGSQQGATFSDFTLNGLSTNGESFVQFITENFSAGESVEIVYTGNSGGCANFLPMTVIVPDCDPCINFSGNVENITCLESNTVTVTGVITSFDQNLNPLPFNLITSEDNQILSGGNVSFTTTFSGASLGTTQIIYVVSEGSGVCTIELEVEVPDCVDPCLCKTVELIYPLENTGTYCDGDVLVACLDEENNVVTDDPIATGTILNSLGEVVIAFAGNVIPSNLDSGTYTVTYAHLTCGTGELELVVPDCEEPEVPYYEMTPSKVALDIGDISPDGDGGVKNGQSITFRLCNTNTGNQPILNSTINDIPPNCFVASTSNPTLPHTQAILGVGQSHCIELVYTPTGCDISVNHTNTMVSSSDNTETEEVELELPSAPCSNCFIRDYADNEISDRTNCPLVEITPSTNPFGAFIINFIGRTGNTNWTVQGKNSCCGDKIDDIGIIPKKGGSGTAQFNYFATETASLVSAYYPGIDMQMSADLSNPDVVDRHWNFKRSCDDDCTLTLIFKDDFGGEYHAVFKSKAEEKTCEVIDFSLADSCEPNYTEINFPLLYNCAVKQLIGGEFQYTAPALQTCSPLGITYVFQNGSEVYFSSNSFSASGTSFVYNVGVAEAKGCRYVCDTASFGVSERMGCFINEAVNNGFATIQSGNPVGQPVVGYYC